MTDRLRTLALLERLGRHEMALEARELGVMRAHVAKLEENSRNLREKLRTEAHIVTLEAAPYVGAFIRSVRAEEAETERAMARAAPRVAELEAAVLARFRNVATLRLALDQTKTKARAEQARRDALNTDTQTLFRWTRRARAEQSGQSRPPPQSQSQ